MGAVGFQSFSWALGARQLSYTKSFRRILSSIRDHVRREG